jgi:hypothetical protein
LGGDCEKSANPSDHDKKPSQRNLQRNRGNQEYRKMNPTVKVFALVEYADSNCNSESIIAIYSSKESAEAELKRMVALPGM